MESRTGSIPALRRRTPVGTPVRTIPYPARTETVTGCRLRAIPTTRPSTMTKTATDGRTESITVRRLLTPARAAAAEPHPIRSSTTATYPPARTSRTAVRLPMISVPPAIRTRTAPMATTTRPTPPRRFASAHRPPRVTAPRRRTPIATAWSTQTTPAETATTRRSHSLPGRVPPCSPRRPIAETQLSLRAAAPPVLQWASRLLSARLMKRCGI